MSNKANISLALSCVAIAVGSVAIMKTAKNKDESTNTVKGIESIAQNTDDKQNNSASINKESVKDLIANVLNNNPKIVYDAMRTYAEQQRELEIKSTISKIREKFDTYTKNAIKIGKVGSKKKVICYIDPNPKYAQNDSVIKRIIKQIEKPNNDVEFNIVPIILDQEANISAVYVAVNKVDKNKIEKFIKSVAKIDKHNQETWEKAMSDAGYKPDQIYAAAEKDAEGIIRQNMVDAAELGLTTFGIYPIFVGIDENATKDLEFDFLETIIQSKDKKVVAGNAVTVTA